MMNDSERMQWIEELRSSQKEKRAAAMQQLAGDGYGSIQSLCSLLHDTDWKVRYRAAEALFMIQAQDTALDLIRATEDPKDHVRYMAAKALSAIGIPAAIPALSRLTSDENEYVRKIALSALNAITAKKKNV